MRFKGAPAFLHKSLACPSWTVFNLKIEIYNFPDGVVYTYPFERAIAEVGCGCLVQTGALPEVLNSRLAMLGFFWALIAENITGKNVFEQVKSQPVLIATTVVLITVASAIPFYKGVRRSGNSVFTPDAELWNGRCAFQFRCM